MIDALARAATAIAATALATAGTSAVAAEWHAGHATSAVAALVGSFVLMATAVVLALDLALDALDAMRLRRALAARRTVPDRPSTIG